MLNLDQITEQRCKTGFTRPCNPKRPEERTVKENRGRNDTKLIGEEKTKETCMTVI